MEGVAKGNGWEAELVECGINVNAQRSVGVTADAGAARE